MPLHRYFTIFAGPISKDFMLAGPHACVVELCAGIFADALECTAVLVVASIWIMMDLAYRRTAVMALHAWNVGAFWIHQTPVAMLQTRTRWLRYRSCSLVLASLKRSGITIPWAILSLQDLRWVIACSLSRRTESVVPSSRSVL